MTATTIAILVVPSATALFIGYLHRRQMRQNELFRLDPKVGVLPPPTPPVMFFKAHWLKLLYGLPVLSLVWLYLRHPQVSFLTVILIAFYFATATFMASTSIDRAVIDRVAALAHKTVDVCEIFDQRIKALENAPARPTLNDARTPPK
jgi:hypothetical protein